MTVRQDLVTSIQDRLSDAKVSGYELDDIDALPALPPAGYAEIHLAATTSGVARAGARSRRTGWRLDVRIVAKTVSNFNVLADRAHDALFDQPLSAEGRSTDRLGLQPSNPPGADDGWYSGLLSYTFTH